MKIHLLYTLSRNLSLESIGWPQAVSRAPLLSLSPHPNPLLWTQCTVVEHNGHTWPMVRLEGGAAAYITTPAQAGHLFGRSKLLRSPPSFLLPSLSQNLVHALTWLILGLHNAYTLISASCSCHTFTCYRIFIRLLSCVYRVEIYSLIHSAARQEIMR